MYYANDIVFEYEILYNMNLSMRLIYGLYQIYNTKVSYIVLAKFDLKLWTKHAKQPLEYKTGINH